MLHRGEDLLRIRAESLGERLADLRPGCRGCRGLQPGQFVDEFRRQGVLPGRQVLAELHEGRPALLKGLTEGLRDPTGRVGVLPGEGRTPRGQPVTDEHRRDLPVAPVAAAGVAQSAEPGQRGAAHRSGRGDEFQDSERRRAEPEHPQQCDSAEDDRRAGVHPGIPELVDRQVDQAAGRQRDHQGHGDRPGPAHRHAEDPAHHGGQQPGDGGECHGPDDDQQRHEDPGRHRGGAGALSRGQVR